MSDVPKTEATISFCIRGQFNIYGPWYRKSGNIEKSFYTLLNLIPLGLQNACRCEVEMPQYLSGEKILIVCQRTITSLSYNYISFQACIFFQFQKQVVGNHWVPGQPNITIILLKYRFVTVTL